MSMKLIDYAKSVGVSYRTAWRWYRAGKIPGHQMDTGTIIVDVEKPSPAKSPKIAVYARVSSSEDKSDLESPLESQAERLTAYCAAKGYQVAKVVKEIGSGVNDSRPKFLALLEDKTIDLIVIEHKDRGTRFGFHYIESLLKTYGRSIEVVSQAEDANEDLIADLQSIIYSICLRLYGQRRAKRKTEKIVAELEKGDDDAAR
jgi:predicted site-specific integrase-resolvase